MSLRRQVILFSVAGVLAVLGVVLLLTAFGQPHSHLLLWYFEDGRVYRYDLRDRAIHDFALPSAPLYKPVLSSNGQYLAYADKAALNIMQTGNGEIVLSIPHIETSARTNLTDTQYSPYAWSPDAQWLLLELYRYEQVGLGIMHVTDGQIEEVKSSAGQRYTCGNTGGAWSSDSSELVITQMDSSFCEWGESQAGVYTASVNSPRASALYSFTFDSQDPFTNRALKITGAAAAPAWQPSSDKIVYIQETGHQGGGHFITSTIQLNLIESDGTAHHVIIANSTGQIFSPIWSPDGQRLFYESNGVDGVVDGVYSMKADGADAKLLIPRKGTAPLAFSPDQKYLATQEHSLNSYPMTIFPAWKDGFQIVEMNTGQDIRFDQGVFLGWQVIND